ncbi:MAG: N-6 DNA methylase [Bacillota bacterium]|nr:N-6 DNA methylase [Bacillota bacterium]
MSDKRALFLQYLKSLAQVNSHGDAREESFYNTLQHLVECVAQASGRPDTTVIVSPRKTEGGNPDFRIWHGENRIVGYIEAKHPRENDLDRWEDTDQVKRYRETFPNFVLTNFLSFRLYRNGERVDSVELATPAALVRHGYYPPNDRVERLWTLLSRFLEFAVPQALNAETLAISLATRTRFLRDMVSRLLSEQCEHSSDILGFYEAFKRFLIAELSPEEFADLYAQTVTYGLFAARTRTENGFSRRMAFDSIPRTIGILRDLFRYISFEELPEQVEWIVDDISAVLASTDVSDILASYRNGRGSDPIVHFYETFLAHYDPEERERRGVYYTPEPVVDYIVRSIHDLLKLRFGKPDGLASADVTILDPAAGTMTFIARCTKEAVQEFTSKYGSGGCEAFICEHILPDFYAFELMIAPYAIGHLKMAFLLEELGHRLTADERVRFYLTNTLDMTEPESARLPLLASLAEESLLAGRVKKEQPILVILGNPPYSGHSANRGKWIREQIDPYKQVDGKPLNERNPKWLHDDYVKFIRFAELKISTAGRGVVSMITNHSYLDNPTFRGMRWHLMQTFDEIYMLDLHGNSLKREVSPDGSPDENVFDIRQGVAIAFFVKKGGVKEGPTRVYHAELWGRREVKNRWLLNHDFANTGWREINPRPEFYLFAPRSEDALERYNTFRRVTDIFTLYSAGIVTARDRLAVRWTPDEMWDTIVSFLSMNPEQAREVYGLGQDVRDWKVAWAQEDVKRSGPTRSRIIPILYRPFDVRYTYYTGRSRGFICMPRSEVMRHMLAGENIALCVGRAGQVVGDSTWTLVHCAAMAEDFNLFYRGGNVNFPLYLYDQQLSLGPTIEQRKSNLRPEVLVSLGQAYGKEPSPEQVFYYIYAVLHAPSYRERYSEFLRIDFPRIPFSADREVFEAMAELGRRLVELHILKSSLLDSPLAQFEGQGDNRVLEDLRYESPTERIYVNQTQYFAPVAPEVWEYQIGGYQVCKKWLKDRQERVLSLDELRTFCRTITALAHTIRLQGEIDDLYPAIEQRPMVF